MRTKLERVAARWLSFESAGRFRAAEAALVRLFELLPAEAPGAGFVDRVLTASGFAPRRRADISGLGSRLAVAACWLLAAVSLSFVPSMLTAFAAAARTAAWGQLLAGLLQGTVRAVARTVTTWETLAGIGEHVAAAMSAPPMLALISASALLSLGALRLLQGLLVTTRSTHHV